MNIFNFKKKTVMIQLIHQSFFTFLLNFWIPYSRNMKKVLIYWLSSF